MRPLLNHLRLTALNCRCAARADLFEACAVLSTDRSQARQAYADSLVRCLSQALANPPVFYRPGVTETTFDEAWLMRLISSYQNGDEASAQFLLRARVSRISQRNLGFLARAVADQFYQV